MSLSLIFAIILFAATPQSLAASRVEVLVETLRRTAKPGDGMGEQEQKLAIKMQTLGPAAIPYLLPLLRDGDKEVRALAAFTLSGMKGLTEEHLDLLIESERRGNGWLQFAIARIGTPRAVAFLVEELVRQRQPFGSADALVSLGEKAVPDLVKVYQNTESWDDALESALASAFQGLGKRGQSAVEPLLKIANDETAAPDRRRGTIVAIGLIGLAAERAVPDLVKLQHSSNETIRSAAEYSIVKIGTAEAVPILLKKIEATPGFERQMQIRNIGRLSARGKSAGPAIMKYLADEDWDVRIDTAFALGCIGHHEATGALTGLLAGVEDWRLVFAAAKALQLLQAKDALPALSQLAKGHWYPPVRAAATSVANAIHGNRAPKVNSLFHALPPDFFNSVFSNYQSAGEELELLKYEELKLLRFPVAAQPNQLVNVNVEKPGGVSKPEQWLGVEVEGGYIFGADRGEWGGEIGFIDRTGHPQVLATENSHAIYKSQHGIFALTGLAHMTLNDGAVFRILKDADGVWHAQKWRTLPGAPQFSVLLSDGRILVNCFGGIVLVSPDGTMKSLSRRESLRKR